MANVTAASYSIGTCEAAACNASAGATMQPDSAPECFNLPACSLLHVLLPSDSAAASYW